jgi:parvulin-like peptidyl-prolyl isomerase
MGSKIHCAHILVEKLSVAQDLKTRISKGESFANLAKEHSTDVSKKRGGDLGFFSRGVMVPNLKKLHLYWKKDKYLIL